MKNDLLLQRSLMPIDREETGTDELTIGRVRDINKITAYGKCVQSNLPPEYTELEYIESSGTQYINTGIDNWNNTLEYEIKLDIRQQNSSYKTYYGAYDAWSTSGHIVPSINTYIDYRMASSFIAGFNSSAGTDIGIRIGQTGIISLKGNFISWSEGNSTQFDRGSAFTINAPIILFGTWSTDHAQEFTKNKMYYAKFWLDGNLVQNLIPCKRNSDNVVGMYDIVSGQFFTNQGTGDFIAGPNVVPIPGGRGLPSDYSELEYLESNGTQYIDTGITLSTTNTSIITDFQYTSNTGYNYLFGALGENGFIGLYNSGSNRLAIMAGSGLQDVTYSLNFDTNRHTLTINYGTSKYKIDSEQETNLSSTLNSTPTRSIYLFMRNYSSDGDYAYAKIYSWKLYESNVIVSDLVPARRKSDNVLGMYDKVSGNFLVNSGTGSFIAGPEIPSRPINIWCNNGVLKARHQSGLPLGYTKLTYLQSSGNAYIDTGVAMTSNYERVVAKFSAEEAFAGNNWRIFGSQNGNRCSFVPWPVNSNENPLGYLAVGQSWYLPKTQNDTISTKLYTPYEMDVTANNENVSGTYCGYEFSSTYIGNVANELNVTLFKNNGQTSWGSGGRIYYFKMWTSENTLAFDGIPARRESDGVLGMYDTVSGQFFTNQGTGTFIAGDLVSDPIEIYTDGLQETIKIQKIPAEYTELEYIESSGTQYINTGIVSNGIGLRSEAKLQLTTNNTAEQAIIGRNSSSGYEIYFSYGNTIGTYHYSDQMVTSMINYDTSTVYTIISEMTENSITQSVNGVLATSYSGVLNNTIIQSGEVSLFRHNFRYPISAKAYYIKLWKNGSLERDFIPAKNTSNVVGMYDLVSGQFFTNAGTGDFIAGPVVNYPQATTEMLLKVGNYQDQQDIINGIVTRRVGIKVLDGTEDWTAYSGIFGLYYSEDAITDNNTSGAYNLDIMSNQYSATNSGTLEYNNTIRFQQSDDLVVSHRLYIRNTNYATATSFKQYLTDQYLAGTPVIIIYPLATPTQETVDGQDIDFEIGTNTIEVSQASLEDLDFKVRYRQK